MKRKVNHRRIKRWTPDEINTIIDYMTEFGNVEKPTARAYYENMLKIYPIEATWDLIKWKVRYLRVIYTKAVQWTESDEAKQLNSAEFEDKLLRMCPLYYRLLKVFGEKRAEIVEIMDSNSSFGDCYDESEDNVDYVEDVKVFEEYNETANYCNDNALASFNITNETLAVNTIANGTETTSMPQHSITHPEVIIHEGMPPNREPTEVEEKQALLENDVSAAKRLKKESLRNSLTALSQSQEGRNEMQRLRLKFEEYKFSQEFEFIKEKFKVEHELKKQELELKRMEIESNEKLRIMEMEKNERIAKYELSIKYNGQSRYSSNLHTD